MTRSAITPFSDVSIFCDVCLYCGKALAGRALWAAAAVVTPPSNMNQQEKTAAAEQYPEVRALITGMLLNIGLTIGKFVIGATTHCAALAADGYKDLAGATRSGLKLWLKHMRTDVQEHKESKRAAVRIESVVSLIVFLLIVYMGLASLVGSIKDVLDQHDTQYTPALFIITAASVVLKACMAHHKRTLGRKLHDTALLREAGRAAVDSVAAGMILGAAVLDSAFHVDVDPWIGCGIAVLIVAAGVRSAFREKRKEHAGTTAR